MAMAIDSDREASAAASPDGAESTASAATEQLETDSAVPAAEESYPMGTHAQCFAK